MTTQKNLLLISLDTLRRDVAYSGRFSAINSLRRRGTTLNTAIASSPLTPISHATVLTGLQPPRHGIRHLLREQLHPTAVTLAMHLREAGHQTGAIVSCPGLNRWYGLDRGFDHYDDWIPPLADGRDALEVVDVELRGTALKRAPMVVDRALEWLSGAQPGPKTLFIHFFDSHWPYEAPTDVGALVDNPYEGEVTYMDHHLGQLLAKLPSLGMTDANTVTVCFSDHGEDLGGWYPDDHAGLCGHPEEKGHGALLFDVTQLVPLIFVGAGIRHGFTVHSQVRLVDVMPTILDLLDLPVPNALDGMSLAAALRGAPVADLPSYMETFYLEELAANSSIWSHLKPLRGVREPTRKIVWQNCGDQLDLYNLVEDPAEKWPLGLTGLRHRPEGPIDQTL